MLQFKALLRKYCLSQRCSVDIYVCMYIFICIYICMLCTYLYDRYLLRDELVPAFKQAPKVSTSIYVHTYECMYFVNKHIYLLHIPSKDMHTSMCMYVCVCYAIVYWPQTFTFVVSHVQMLPLQPDILIHMYNIQYICIFVYASICVCAAFDFFFYIATFYSLFLYLLASEMIHAGK